MVCDLQQNRPLNSQNVADALQKFNLKKAAIQKALDTLADSGRISFKEYGKQKIYIARQDQFDIPNNEELNQMKEENGRLQAKLNETKKAVSEVEGGILPKAFEFLSSRNIHTHYNHICKLYLIGGCATNHISNCYIFLVRFKHCSCRN